MSTKPTEAPSKKKNQPAPPDLVKAVGKLLDVAMKAQAPSQLQAMTRDKLFEMLVLTRMLRAFRRLVPGGRVVHQPPGGGSASVITVACKPALADKNRFSYFQLIDSTGVVIGETWTSVEFESLSWTQAGGAAGKAPRRARHELDVCILKPGADARPPFHQVLAGVSCKDVRTATKENVREALGLRRETAYLNRPARSAIPWLIPLVPAHPASPIFLASSDLDVRKYESPVDALGVYVRFVRRPWEAES